MRTGGVGGVVSSPVAGVMGTVAVVLEVADWGSVLALAKGGAMKV